MSCAARPGCAAAPVPLTGHGSADKLDLEGENQFRFFNATWTSCKPDRPDWYLKAKELQLDYDKVAEPT